MDKVLVYGVQNIVTGEVKDAHEVVLRFYVDKDLKMTATLKEVFHHAFTHRASLRWPESSTFWMPKTGRILTSRWTELGSARERVRGSCLRTYETVPQSFSCRSCGSCVCVCGSFTVSRSNLLCLLHCQALLIHFWSKGALGYCRVGHIW